MSAPVSYYVKHKKRLLWEFDLVAKFARSVTEKYFDGNADAVLAEARREFEGLIPPLPDVGGRQPFTEFVVFTGMLLAVYWIGKAHGQTVEQTGVMIHEFGRAFLKSFPPFLLRLLMPTSFSRKSFDRLQKRAIESHARRYPEGYVFDFLEGDGVHFDYGVDYLECASCKFLAKQGASEIAPYLCPVDILYSNALGWGLMRTQTLAEGAERCDFRFKRGGKTNVVVPDALRAIVAQSE
jgi:hypothetical protein